MRDSTAHPQPAALPSQPHPNLWEKLLTRLPMLNRRAERRRFAASVAVRLNPGPPERWAAIAQQKFTPKSAPVDIETPKIQPAARERTGPVATAA